MVSLVSSDASTNGERASRLTRMARRRPLSVFFCLAYLIFWVGALPLVLSRTGLGLIPVDVPMTFFFPLTYAPTLAAILTHWLAERDFRVFRLHGSWRRLLLGASAGSLVLIAAVAVIPAVLVVKGSARALHWSVLVSFDSISLVTFLGGPLGEEAGWRGYALPRLQALFGPLKASLLLGVVWAVWHLPLFLTPGYKSATFPVFAVCVICATLIMTFGANLSKFSIAAAVLIHFAFNSAIGLFGGLVAGAQRRTSVTQEVVMPLSLLATAAVVVILTRGRLAARRDPSPAHLF